MDEIFDKFVELSEKKINKKMIKSLLEKYDIDINYADSSLLREICIAHNYEEIDDPNYHNIKILMDMGADPTPLPLDDILGAESHPMLKIRLDAIFKLYGYNCEWGKRDLDFEKLGRKMLYPTEGWL